MQALHVGEKDIPLNQDGYLVNFDDWTPDVAKTMAEDDELELNECHWAAIKFMREYYSTFDIPPSPQTMVKEVGAKLHPYRCTTKTLESLFPLGGCKHACRLAGLPVGYCYSC